MGKKLGIEIVITGLVAENIPKNLEYYDELLILCLDDNVKQKVLKQVEKHVGLSDSVKVGLLRDHFIPL